MEAGGARATPLGSASPCRFAASAPSSRGGAVKLLKVSADVARLSRAAVVALVVGRPRHAAPR